MTSSTHQCHVTLIVQSLGGYAMVVRFRLQELLDSHDPPMSQSELSRRSGVNLFTINNIANNRTAQVALKTLGSLAAALGVEPGDLLVGSSRSRKR